MRGEVKTIRSKAGRRSGKIRKDPNLAGGERSQSRLFDEQKEKKSREAKRHPPIEDRNVG